MLHQGADNIHPVLPFLPNWAIWSGSCPKRLLVISFLQRKEVTELPVIA